MWKTVAKGSKDKSMVKKIQRALKKNGFYLSYKGRYLKVDGLFHKYTQMAVKQFQKAKKLKVTGKVDYATAVIKTLFYNFYLFPLIYFFFHFYFLN